MERRKDPDRSSGDLSPSTTLGADPQQSQDSTTDRAADPPPRPSATSEAKEQVNGSQPLDEPQDPDRAQRIRRRMLILALMLTLAVTAMDSTIVSTAVPQIVSELGGFTIFSWVFSGYLLAQTVTIPVYGKLADLYGRKPVLVTGTLVFLLGSTLCAIAWNMPSLIVARVVQGLGAGSIQATVLTVAADLYPVRQRGKIQAALSSVWGTSAVVGPSLGGAFVQYASWRWIFIINLPLGVAGLSLIIRHLHERLERGRPSIDWAGAALMLGAGVSLILALVQGGVAWSWLSAPSLGLLGTAAVLIAAVIVVERRAIEPIMPSWIWTRRVLAGVNASQLCVGILTIGPTAFLPVYSQVVLGLGPIAAGLVMATMSMSWPVAAALSNRLYLRIGFRDTALIGAVIATTATGWVALLPYRPSPLPVIGATLLLGSGMGLLSATLVIGAQSTVGHWQRGTVTASVVFSRFLGQSLGAAVLGAVSNSALANRLAKAPADLRASLPNRIDDIGNELGRDSNLHLGSDAADYLRRAMAAATHNVYLCLATAAAAALLLLIFVIPRRFAVQATASDESADAPVTDAREAPSPG